MANGKPWAQRLCLIHLVPSVNCVVTVEDPR